MKTVSRQLGKKYSEGRRKRFREHIERLKTEGHKFGVSPDPRTRIETRICELPSCGEGFPFRIQPKTDAIARGHYCCQNHAIRHVSILRRKVPADFDLLHDLYVVQNKTTVEIAEMFDSTHGAVGHRLLDVGIKPRKAGISRYTICVEDGCKKPIHRIKHKTNGSWYGKRCREHWKAHRARVCADYAKRNRPKINAYQQKARARKKHPQVIEQPKWLQAAIGP